MQTFIHMHADASRDDVARIAKENNILPLLAAALINRGINDRAQIQAFLHPSLDALHDPLDMPDMLRAVERIRRALEQKERICVYGDYDADGVCATAILLGYLEKAGADCRYYIPSRHQEGYGLNMEAVEGLRSDGVTLLITVDNGISAVDEIARIGTYGIDVIVTDHHRCADILPDCVAVVNAHRPDSRYPYRELCGAGVAFKLVQALCGDISACLPLVALATVADIVPLTGENRVLVSLGLPYVSEHTGLSELLRVSSSGTEDITSETLAFRLAPRINAAGRMADADRALRLLMTQDIETAHALSISLDEENTGRQREEQRILKEAERMLSARDIYALPAILLHGEGWNPGVIGIVASKLVERHYRPVLLFQLKDGLLTGSCRSIQGIHMFDCLHACGDRLIRYGGHAKAAGLTLRLEELERFREELFEHILKTATANTYVRAISYEIEAELKDVNVRAVEALSLLAPHGEGNPRPVFLTRGVRLLDRQRIGSAGAHLRANVAKGGAQIPLIAFGSGDKEGEWHTAMDILYTAQLNSWMGQKRLQLQLHAVKPPGLLEYALSPASTGQDHKQSIYKHTTITHAHIVKKFYDAFFYNVIYNVMHTKKADYEPRFDETLVSALKRDIHGVLILCLSPTGALALRELLVREGLFDCLRVCITSLPDERDTPHTLLLAPRLENTCTDSYRAVFICDLGELNGLICIPECREGLPVSVSESSNHLLDPLVLSRERMGRLYSEFMQSLHGGPVKRSALTNGDYAAKTLALLVFLELGFFTWDRGSDAVAVSKTVQKRSLLESRVYALANGPVITERGGASV